VKVAIAGGGTAGHVFPALALADRLRTRGHEVSFVGSPDGQEAVLVPAAGYTFHAVRAQKMVRTLSFATASAPFVALRSVRACEPLVRSCDAVVGVGGYVSAPAVLAARRARVRIILHEQNAIPGLANRLLSRVAETVALSFAGAASRLPRGARTVVTGNPVRAAIREVPTRRAELRAEALAAFGFEEARTTIAVFGGSQGALRLDRTVAGALRSLRDREDLQVLVLAGPANVEVITSGVGEPGPVRIHVLPFLERMELALAAADLAVSRAGSGHLAELAVCGVASILVPYPHATENHQEANARELERAGAARVALEAELTPERLAAMIVELADDPVARRAMGSAARSWSKPDADERLAALVEGAP
jgi:UDP-N-acetylglucosamine--N-acetylmuramyl-(pentapeptide) pyrophosphoryl-undecaprenol N-acetylglucosamine transferase